MNNQMNLLILALIGFSCIMIFLASSIVDASPTRFGLTEEEADELSEAAIRYGNSVEKRQHPSVMLNLMADGTGVWSPPGSPPARDQEQVGDYHPFFGRQKFDYDEKQADDDDEPDWMDIDEPENYYQLEPVIPTETGTYVELPLDAREDSGDSSSPPTSP